MNWDGRRPSRKIPPMNEYEVNKQIKAWENGCDCHVCRTMRGEF